MHFGSRIKVEWYLPGDQVLNPVVKQRILLFERRTESKLLIPLVATVQYLRD